MTRDIKKHPSRIPFRINYIDLDDKKISNSVIRYRTTWTTTKFTKQQQNMYKKEIDDILTWFKQDINTIHNTNTGLYVLWKETYEKDTNLPMLMICFPKFMW